MLRKLQNDSVILWKAYNNLAHCFQHIFGFFSYLEIIHTLKFRPGTFFPDKISHFSKIVRLFLVSIHLCTVEDIHFFSRQLHIEKKWIFSYSDIHYLENMIFCSMINSMLLTFIILESYFCFLYFSI